MKFKSSIDIAKPIALVTKIFANPENLKEFQEGFQKKELISGTAGQNGAVSKMYYAYGKRTMELVETITANNLPDSFEAHYHHKHMDNTYKCTFTPVDENTTRYETETVYTRIDWIMPRLMFIFFKSMYRKQGEKWMNNFKVFVEKQQTDNTTNDE